MDLPSARRAIRELAARAKSPWVVHRSRDSGSATSIAIRSKLPALLLLALLTLELLYPSRVWVTLLLAFASMVAISVVWAWQMVDGIQAGRTLRYRLVQVGDLLEERFWLDNGSVLPALWVEVVDRGNMPGYDASTVRTVGGQSSYRWVSSGSCTRRGEFRLGPWDAVTRDPLGIFEVVRSYDSSETVLVYPPIAERLPFSLPRGSSAGYAHVSQRSWEPTVTTGGVRAYVPGDPRHHIHWPTTARRSQLFAKEFDQETGGDVWLVLDADPLVQAGSGVRSTLEMGIVIAGSAAAAMLDARRAVGLAGSGPGGEIVLPGRGRPHLWRLLRALAKATTEEAQPLATELNRLSRVLPPGSTALIVTPSLDSSWVPELGRLRGRGIGASVVLLDAPSFDASPLGGVSPHDPSAPASGKDVRDSARAWQPTAGAQNIKGMLADVQVAMEIVDADVPLRLRPVTGQVRRWQFKVLPTGRAIAVSSPLEHGA